MKKHIYFKITLLYLCLLQSQGYLAAQNIVGQVFEKNEANIQTPLVGANVFWLNTTKGTTTDAEGKFSLAFSNKSNQLVFSYLGFKSDTLTITSSVFLKITLQPSANLETIVVKDNKPLDRETANSELLTVKDLRKAACCNLSESFETNPSVDVSTTDAVTGGKQIKMLGLDGIYSQIMREGIPVVRGLSARNGLGFIPGTWVKSIDINKGAGSVVNGYESITGQINVELAKPEASEKLLLNGYVNANGRIEGNLNSAFRLNEKWSSALLLHSSNLSNRVDMNEDGFVDTPLYTQLNFINCWKYQGENFEMQLGGRVLLDDKIAGQTGYRRGQSISRDSPYGFEAKTQQGELFGKFGFFSKTNLSQSLGIIFSAAHHNQDSFWGLNTYQAQQNTLNVQAIFQTDLGEAHKIRTGLSYLLDDYDELYTPQTMPPTVFDRQRTESVPGIFIEHTFNPNEKLGIVAGLRADFHNLFGTFFTPRLHIKYELAKNSILRLSGGRGFRVANPIAENIGFLISSRTLNIAPDLQPEIAWNYGGNFTQVFTLFGREATLTLDFYRTDFQNQVILDLDSSSDLVVLYNQKGNTWANSFQANLAYSPFKGFDWSFAYKYYDVKTRIMRQIEEAPFVARHRVFTNFAYSTFGERWQFDFTTQWIGSQRFPKGGHSQEDQSSEVRSPSLWLFSGQITYKINQKWDVYLGGENLSDLMQHDAVLNANTPFDQGFDAGMIYGPVMGRVIYAGFRFTVL